MEDDTSVTILRHSIHETAWDVHFGTIVRLIRYGHVARAYWVLNEVRYYQYPERAAFKAS
jgi:hypothetical protein